MWLLPLPGFQKFPTKMGFEPTRAEPFGLAVQRLNHSATSSPYFNQAINLCFINIFQKIFPRRESNPGPLGESQIS